jgi:hypothetical protein
MSYDKFKPIIFGNGKFGRKTRPLLATNLETKPAPEKLFAKYELINGVWKVKTVTGVYKYASYEKLVCGLSDMEFLGLVPKGTTEGLRK